MIKQKPLQIFSKDADMGIDVVKSPVKLTILEMLRSNDMEFDEIVRNTGKSKSTISVHLKSLRNNLIQIRRIRQQKKNFLFKFKISWFCRSIKEK